MHHPNCQEEHEHERVELSLFRLCDDVCVLQHHFVGECVDRRDDERCPNFKVFC